MGGRRHFLFLTSNKFEAPGKKPQTYHFSYMGQIKNEKTRQKVEFLKNVIDEILFLEEYANEC